MATYLVEAGILLIVAPWTPFWHQNYFASQVPWMREWLSSSALRAGVSAVGLMTFLGGIREFSGAFALRRARLSASADPPHQ